jgi:hypothetical protein
LNEFLENYQIALCNEGFMPILMVIGGPIVAIWATIWATCDTARLVGLRPDGPVGCGAALPVRWRGLPGVSFGPALWRVAASDACLSPVRVGVMVT